MGVGLEVPSPKRKALRLNLPVVEEGRGKGSEEGKLIFVDCYADWCGPCKQLASQVFTQKEVGDVFNSHFVNVQFNVEKDADGKANVAKWGVASLPTFVFIDPKTEQVIGKLVGAGDAAWLVNGSKSRVGSC